MIDKADLSNVLKTSANTVAELVLSEEFPNSSLVNGYAGALLALGYSKKIGGLDNTKINSAIDKSIDMIIQSLGNDAMDGSLYFGYSGIAFTLRLLQSLGAIDIGISDLENWLEPLDAEIDREFDKSLHHGDYDLFTGAIGNLVYYKLTDRFSCKLEKYGAFLSAKKKLDNDGSYWTSVDYFVERGAYEENTKYVNLGLAHGVPSILSSFTWFSDELIEKHQGIIDGSLQWFIRKKVDDQQFSFYHSFHLDGEEGKDQKMSRLAWCYGDLGIGYTFLKIGKQLKRNDIYDMGYEILTKTCRYRDIKNSQINESGFCHGHLGAAYIYWKSYLLTCDPVMFQASQYWLGSALEGRDFTVSQSGFFEYDSANIQVENRTIFLENSERFRSASGGLLSGHGGIVLVLLTLITEEKLSWDRLFLFS